MTAALEFVRTKTGQRAVVGTRADAGDRCSRWRSTRWRRRWTSRSSSLAYVMMALGLNIVVGFAGLLDLGYVAFYAIGAYTIGWLASDHFTGIGGDDGIHILTSDFVSNALGIHVNFFLVLFAAMAIAAVLGAVIGLPTLRLRGDYIAIVTLAFGEIIGRIALNGDEITFGELPAHERPAGDLPRRPAVPTARQLRVRLGVQPAPVLLDRPRAAVLHAVRELPAARLTARPGLDRAA